MKLNTDTLTPDPEVMRVIFGPRYEIPAGIDYDLAMHRRLLAMQERMTREDDPNEPPTTFDEVIYCAIMGGLRESERDSGEPRNENTGMPLAISPYRDPHPRRTRLRAFLKLILPH